MAAIIDAFSRIRKVDEVTSASDTSPPVYLMDEIVVICKGSPSEAESVADLLAKKLGNRSPVVKYKALRVVRHLCMKGCTQFQRSIQRHANALRELAHYKGEQDPYKGDAANQRVREAAVEAVEIMFNSIANPTAATSNNLQSRIQGFGSGGEGANAPLSLNQPSGNANTFPGVPTHGHGGSNARGGGSTNASQGFPNGPGSVQPSRMVGFGSDSSYRPGQQAGGGGAAGAGPGVGVGEMMSSLGSNVNSFIRSTFNGETSEHTGYLTAGTDAPYSQHSSPHPPPHYSYPNNAAQARSAHLSGNGNGNPAAAAGSDFPAYNAADFESASNAALGSSAGEQAVVDAMCTPGGMRVAPEAQDLRQFVESVSGMDGLRVAELLRDKMTGPSWQSLLRALYALEAVLEQGMTQSCGEIAVMFQSDNSPVQAALHHTQALVRDRAHRVWPLLSSEDLPPDTSGGGAGMQQPAAAVDLLGGLMDDDIPTQSTQQPTPGNGGMGDMFGGMALSPAATGSSPQSYTAQPHTALPYAAAAQHQHVTQSLSTPPLLPQHQQPQQQQQWQQPPQPPQQGIQFMQQQAQQQQQQGVQFMQQQQQRVLPPPIALPPAAAAPTMHAMSPSPATALRGRSGVPAPLDDLFSDLSLGLQPRSGAASARPMALSHTPATTAATTNASHLTNAPVSVSNTFAVGSSRPSPTAPADPFSLLVSTPAAAPHPTHPPQQTQQQQQQQQQYLPTQANPSLYGGGNVASGGGGGYGFGQTLQGGQGMGQQQQLQQQQQQQPLLNQVKNFAADPGKQHCRDGSPMHCAAHKTLAINEEDTAQGPRCPTSMP
ncbi:MAG: hypothetical protein WDW36_000769 [Sanguina aurantia]